jgi:hypothetical protein
MSVFFHSLHVSKQNKVTVICSDVPTSDSMFEMDIDGLEFGMAATPQAVQYGVLAFRDTKTKKPVDARTWDGLALLRTWQRGKELPGLTMGAKPVIDQKTGKETGMVWVERAKAVISGEEAQ